MQECFSMQTKILKMEIFYIMIIMPEALMNIQQRILSEARCLNLLLFEQLINHGLKYHKRNISALKIY